MAKKPLRPCRYPGCKTLVPGGYCAVHRPPPRGRSEEASSWLWMYGTKLWREDLRPAQLLRSPWCAECAKRGLRVRASEVDHIQPHRGDWERFTDRSNLQSLCHRCHSRKTLAEMRAKNAAFSPRPPR